MKWLSLLLIVGVCHTANSPIPQTPARGVVVPAGGGGGAGPFTFIASASNSTTGTGTTLSTSTALNLAAGDLVVVWTEWQSAVTGDTVAVDENDGTDTFTTTAAVVNSSDIAGTFNYLLNAPADAAFTVRTTISASSTRIALIAYQFRPTTAPAVLDASTTPATGSSTAVASATISTSVADSVVFGGSSHASGTTTIELINGVTRGGKVDVGGFTSMWYLIPTATFAAGTASATVGANDLWVGGVIAFK